MHLSVSTFTPRHFPNCNEAERTAAKNDKVLISGKGKSSGGISYYSQSVSRYAWNVFTAYQISKSSRRRGREGGEVFCPHQEKVSCNPPVSFKLFGVDMHCIDFSILQLSRQFKIVFYLFHETYLLRSLRWPPRTWFVTATLGQLGLGRR